MNWAQDFGGAWHGAKDFQQLYRKIQQNAVLWAKKWAGWLDLSQNLKLIIQKDTDIDAILADIDEFIVK